MSDNRLQIEKNSNLYLAFVSYCLVSEHIVEPCLMRAKMVADREERVHAV